MTLEELHNLLNKAYLMGFNNTCEGYNGEYPFDDKEINPEDDKGWVERRDANVNELVRTNEMGDGKAEVLTNEEDAVMYTCSFPEDFELEERKATTLANPTNTNKEGEE